MATLPQEKRKHIVWGLNYTVQYRIINYENFFFLNTNSDKETNILLYPILCKSRVKGVMVYKTLRLELKQYLWVDGCMDI